MRWVIQKEEKNIWKRQELNEKEETYEQIWGV
jgi:hypothetical protein